MQSAPTLSLAATGHRPNKLGGYSVDLRVRLTDHAVSYLHYINKTNPISEVISGMALGWDTAIAEAALQLSLPLVCAIPFPQQPALWPSHSVAYWAEIKAKAKEVHIVSDFYTPTAFQQRNEWMVDRANYILALWNGSEGGTANCLTYARLKNKFILNVWDSFKCP